MYIYPYSSQWFTDATADDNFMTVKYRADLHYYHKKYSHAATEYETTLKLVPRSNTVIIREVNDNLARCLLRIGQPEQALAKALTLVQNSRCLIQSIIALSSSQTKAPHDNDFSAWKLVADCQAALKDITGT